MHIVLTIALVVFGVVLTRVGEHAKRLSRTLPRVEAMIVPNAGHMLPVAYPEAVVDAVGRRNVPGDIGSETQNTQEDGKLEAKV